MKMRFKRFLSGFMAIATLASTIIQPVTVSASELEPEKIPFEQQYAELKDVQDSLDPNEIVEANDIELSYGQEFDVEVDLSGIEGVDESKIKVLFHEAKNETGTDFDTHIPDTYKAVYAVEPVSGHPAYRISRNITVKEPKTEAITTSNSSENTTGEGNAGETDAAEDVHLALIFCLELCNGGLVLGGAAGAHAVFTVALGVAMAGEAQRGQALRTRSTCHILQGIFAIAHGGVAMDTGLLIICHR